MTNNTASTKKFGTFGGVFTPSILTILGVIMFLRAGYVIGQGGIANTLFILIMAMGITLITALSISAIATNTPVKGGGAYFLISRALGPQFGGSIGLVLYLAQAISIPFYIIGFTTAIVSNFPAAEPYFMGIALTALIILFTLNYISSGLAVKSQYIVLALLFAAIIAFLAGSLTKFNTNTLTANWRAEYTDSANFWIIFAIYFPAATGILAGVNMSGNLKTPARSIVRGTIAAIAIGFTVYLLQILICGGSQTRDELVGKSYEMLVQNAIFGMGFLVIMGVFAATISSAMGSLLGAPRILQALARDRIIPGLGVFAAGSRQSDEPRAALWVTLVISMAVIIPSSGKDAASSFNLIATIITMFFLCTYGLINLSAFVESFGKNPSFRPKFSLYHWTISLMGALACLIVMLLINALAASMAIVIISILYLLIKQRVLHNRFGDARWGFIFSLIAKNLQRMGSMQLDPKNWRPIFLVLARKEERYLPLIKYADWLEGGRGIVTLGQIYTGEFDTYASRRESAMNNIEKFIMDHDLQVYPEVVFSKDLDDGLRVLIQSHSIGALKPNTVLFGWPHAADRIASYIRNLRDTSSLGKNVIAVKDNGLPDIDKVDRKIDIWWLGKNNGSLMLILAHLLMENSEWQSARVRVLRMIENEAGRESTNTALNAIIAASRIDATAETLVSSDCFSDVFRRHSASADVIFMGLQTPESGEEIVFHTQINSLLKEMPTTIMVNSTGDADLLA